MADTRIRARKATAALREDHEKVQRLFSDYEDLKDEGSNDEKMETFKQIQDELTVHATIEEEIFYPALEGVDKGKKEGDDLVAEAQEEHQIVKTLLSELSELTPSDIAFDAKMKVLQENVEHHIEEEQDSLFTLFDELEKEEQDRISDELAARKRELSGE